MPARTSHWQLENGSAHGPAAFGVA
jgi:hypothetical protein